MAAKHPKIADAAKKAGADIILVQSARSLDKMGQPNSRILAVTDSYLALYTTPKYSEAKFYWIDTDSYSFSGRAIEMRFGSEDVITFEPEDPTPVHCLILNLLEGCLPPADSVKLQLAQYDHHARPIGGTGLIGPYKALVSKMQKPITNDNVTRALRALAGGRASTFNPARSPVKGKNNK
jgi:hypothetical protein